MSPNVPAVRVLRAHERFVTRGEGIVSRHCFSFGPHYDPANTSFGPMVACNDESLSAGSGFASHPHAGIAIITWIVQGRLEHMDSSGRVALSGPGVVQILHTGRGVSHQEVNAGEGVCRFVQTWLATPNDSRLSHYEQADVSADLSVPSLAALLQLDECGARMYAGRLPARTTADLPVGPLVHVYVVSGSLALNGAAQLEQGDSARLTESGAIDAVTGARGADVLVWEMSAASDRDPAG
jgi:redox-sensitive bicupin YhaK (pirin superfamily)